MATLQSRMAIITDAMVQLVGCSCCQYAVLMPTALGRSSRPSYPARKQPYCTLYAVRCTNVQRPVMQIHSVLLESSLRPQAFSKVKSARRHVQGSA